MSKYRMIVSPLSPEGYLVKLVSLKGALAKTVFLDKSPEIPSIDMLISKYNADLQAKPA